MDRSNYIFTSERLGFRRWKSDDKEKFYQINADSLVMKYFPSTLSREESDQLYEKLVKHFDDHGFGFYAVDSLTDQSFIGFLGIKYIGFRSDFTPGIEIGWRLDKKFWNMGLATEGAKKCLDFAFTKLELDEIYSFAPKINIPSLRVMEKIGMEKLREFIHPEIKENSPLQPFLLYKIQKKEI